MRLAVIRQRYTPYGGAERFVEAALEALLERDIAISLYTRAWPDTKLQLIEPVICNPPYVGRLWRDWSFARAVCRALRRGAADLVQSHERIACCDVYRAGDGVHAVWLEQRARVEGRAARLASLASPYHRYVLAAERRLFTSPWLSRVICNSAMVKDEIVTRFGLPPERLTVIHNAVDSDAFHPGLRSLRGWVRERHHISDSATLFLLVGSGYQRKGVATAIRAIAMLPPTTHLMVVGRDRDMAHYAALARSLGIAGRVTLAGPQIEPKPYFGAADAFVLPTLYDPCPNAALEAMACGLPVITSTKSGAAELVRAHDAGFVCDALNVDALAQHMRTLQDETLRARQGAAARNAVLPLTPAAMTLKLVLLYRDLLATVASARSADAAATPAPPASTAAAPSALDPRTVAAASPEVLAVAGPADAAGELAATASLPEPPTLDEEAPGLPPEVDGAEAAGGPAAGTPGAP